jgi:GGDEF domain-containing protein
MLSLHLVGRKRSPSEGTKGMIERRPDPTLRKRPLDASGDVHRALLVSDKTGLPNRRAFEHGIASPFVALSNVQDFEMLNVRMGHSAGDELLRRFAGMLAEVGLDVYHEQGDEFLCKGKSYQELNRKLTLAQRLLKKQPFLVCGLNGRIATINGADFCFGIGTNLDEAEASLKHQKELRNIAGCVLWKGET